VATFKFEDIGKTKTLARQSEKGTTMLQAALLENVPEQQPGRYWKNCELGELNYKLLKHVACWSLTDAEVKLIFPSVSPAHCKSLRQKLNRDLVRVTMLVLSLGSFDSEPDIFSIRKLARVLDRPREESMQRTLRNWLLPTLSDAAWIRGFAVADGWSTLPQEIQITAMGLAAVKRYLHKVSDIEGDVR
jgi:hypothetical protein